MKYIITIIVLVVLSLKVSGQCIDDTHSPFQNQGWMSCNTSVGPIPERGNVHWIRYDLGDVYVLDSMYIWNHNVWGETGMGVKEIMIDYSIDEQNWKSVGPFTIEKGSGSWKYQGGAGPSLDNILTQFIVISVLSTHDEDVTCAGVGEFLFYIGDLVDVEDTELSDLDWNISPNPATDKITVTLPDIDVVSISLHNSVGLKIAELPLPAGDQITVPINDLRKGLYYINYQSIKESRSKSFVKVN